MNSEGKMDVIYNQGHSYGTYWLEQHGGGASRTWVKHTIDESFSQVHALKMADIDGYGEPELIAGKLYRGHAGDDPGSYDPLVVYYYKIDRNTGTFTCYPMSVNGTAVAGMQFVVEDLDGEGDLDIVTAGKTGPHFFENLCIDHVSKAEREKEILLDRNWPSPGEGQVAKQGHEPKEVEDPAENTIPSSATTSSQAATRQCHHFPLSIVRSFLLSKKRPSLPSLGLQTRKECHDLHAQSSQLSHCWRTHRARLNKDLRSE